jgi:hypothetical protein
MNVMPKIFNPDPSDSDRIAKLKEKMRYDYEQLLRPDATFITTDAEIANAVLNIADAYSKTADPYNAREDVATEKLGNAAVEMILPFLADIPATGEQQARDNSRRRHSVINLMCQPGSPKAAGGYIVHKFASLLEIKTKKGRADATTAETCALLLSEMAIMPEVVPDMPADAVIAGGLLKPTQDEDINKRKLTAFKALSRNITMAETGLLAETLAQQIKDYSNDARVGENSVAGEQIQRNITFCDDMMQTLQP